VCVMSSRAKMSIATKMTESVVVLSALAPSL
jgi:hypothetical protein